MKRAIILLLVLVITLDRGDLRGCGWDFSGDEFRFWLLQPELTKARTLAPFHFSSGLHYSLDIEAMKADVHARNILEWQQIVGSDVAPEAIEEILYGYGPKHFFDQEEELFRTNGFMKAIARQKRGWPEYIRYAKRCESYVNASDPWGFASTDTSAMRSSWEEGSTMLKKARGSELRARIAYQLVRLGHYAELPHARIEAVYHEHLLPLKGKSWLEPSAAFYVASMLPADDRDLAFAKFFGRAADKQFRMVQLYQNINTEDFIMQADDDRHSASLLVMRLLQHPGRALQDLERIAEWDPSNPHFPMLLTREVNKLEDWLLTPPLTNNPPAIHQYSGYDVSDEEVVHADLDYLRQVQGFIARIAQDAAEDQRPLLKLLNGHLVFVAGDLELSRRIFAEVEADPNATMEIKAQAGMGRIIAGIIAEERLTDGTRAEILKLVELVHGSPDLENGPMLLDQIHLYLGRQLIDRGEKAEGIFLLARTGRAYSTGIGWGWSSPRHVAFEEAGPADYDRMVELLEKEDKTSFEHYLTGSHGLPEAHQHNRAGVEQAQISRNKMLDYKGTWYIEHGQLDSALAAFQRIPDDFWQDYYYNPFAQDDPFVVDTEDPYNYEKRDSASYNKRTYVQRMLELEALAERSPADRALSYYRLGNSHYNMTWHGKYWIMLRIHWSTWHGQSGNERTPSNDVYFGCIRARTYYLAAMREAKDPELKAMAYHMVRVCERNWYNYSGEEVPDALELTRREQKDRRFQKAYRLIKECISYQDFVARFR